jgi:hypothetical protein
MMCAFIRLLLGERKVENSSSNVTYSSPIPGLPAELFVTLASQLFDLHSRRRTWRHRRVEAIEWLGESLYRRRVSVDFTTPDRADFPQYWNTIDRLGHGQVIIPLSMMRKGVLHAFDIIDESRHSIPVLTRFQHEAIAVAALLTRANKAIENVKSGTTLDENLQDELVSIVRENNPEVAKANLDKFENPRLGPRTGAPQIYSEQRDALMSDGEFKQILGDFADQYLMCVYLRGAAGVRRILKFGYEDQARPVVDESRHRVRAAVRLRWQILRQYFGWLPRVTHVETADISSAQSYHIEVGAPTELLIARADLKPASQGGAAPLRSESMARRVHFHLPNTDYPSGADFKSMDLEVQFALEPQGFLFSVMLIAVITFLLLFSGLLWHFDGVALKQQDTAAGVVVALPGLLAALLFRSDEERLVAVSVIGLRAIAAMLVLASLTAAGLLVVNIDAKTRLYLWCAVTVFAGLLALTTVVGWRLSCYWARVASPREQQIAKAGQASTSPVKERRPEIPRPGPGLITPWRALLTVLGIVGLLGLYGAVGGRWPSSLPWPQLSLALWIGLAVLAGLAAVSNWLAAFLGWWWRRTSPDIIR